MFENLLEMLSVKDRPFYVRLLVFAFFIAGPAAALLAAYNNFYNARVGWLSTEVTQPHDAYAQVAPDAAAWAPKTAYRDAFLAEFSRRYFGHPSRWAAFREGAGAASLNVVLQNLAVSSPVLINTVSVVATLEQATPFPWRSLDVDAKLEVTAAENGGVSVRSAGLGPLIDLQIEATAADDIALAAFQRDVLTSDAVYQVEPDAAEGAYVLLETYSPDVLEFPLYQELATGDTPPAGAPALQCQREAIFFPDVHEDACAYAAFRWPDGEAELVGPSCNCDTETILEVVETTTRLRELTRVVEIEELNLNYRHKDLKGVEAAGMASIALEYPVQFYRASPGLLTAPPFDGGNLIEEFAYGLESATDALTSLDVSVPARLAGLAFGDKQADRGVALISTVHEVEVGALSECAFTQSVKQPRELLAGSGYVSVHLDLMNTRNGRYLIRVLVNGEEVRALRFDVLRPDDDSFDDDDVGRFAERPPRPPSPCAPPPAPAAE